MQGRKLSQVIAMWLNVQIATTREAYEEPMNGFLSFIGQDTVLTNIQPEALALYVQGVENRETVRSLHTVNRHIKTLKTFFNWAEKMQFILSNPARVLKKRSTSDYVRRDKAMSDIELNTIIAHAQRRIEHETRNVTGGIINIDLYRDLALVLFLADTGCRRGGASRLKLTDLDLDNRSAIVLEKGAKERNVWYGTDCAEALSQWFEMRSQWLIQNNHGLRDVYVFQRYGEQLAPAALGQRLRRICLAAGVRSLGPHSLRHRKGHSLQKETDIVTASIVLGHSDSSITARYYFKRDTAHAEEIVRGLAFNSNVPKQPHQQPADRKIIHFPKAASE